MSGVSRRDFLKAAALTGASAFIAANKAEVVRAFETAKENGVKLVWLQGQSCSACTVSLLQASDPELYDAIEELKVNIAFHQTIMQPFGDQAIEVLENIEPDVLVVEGAIPVGMKEACLLGE
ncbi:NADH-quinone oxidoreductase subunit B family protein, partial [Geoglobus sp.]